LKGCCWSWLGHKQNLVWNYSFSKKKTFNFFRFKKDISVFFVAELSLLLIHTQYYLIWVSFLFILQKQIHKLGFTPSQTNTNDFNFVYTSFPSMDGGSVNWIAGDRILGDWNRRSKQEIETIPKLLRRWNFRRLILFQNCSGDQQWKQYFCVFL